MWNFLSRVRGVSLRFPKLKDSGVGETLGPVSGSRMVEGSGEQVHKVRPKLTVLIEGNIGSGKTTLLDYMTKFKEVEIVPERVDKWCDLQGNNLLNLMYQDPERWAYAFQSYVQLTMVENHMQATSTPVKLMERSLHSARYCFVENLYQSGKMKQAEYYVYDAWYKRLCEIFDCRADLIVYLRTEPQLVYERAKIRARSEEKELPVDYFQQLHDRYEEWFEQKKFDLPCPVLVVNANEDLATMYTKYEQYARKIITNKALQAIMVND